MQNTIQCFKCTSTAIKFYTKIECNIVQEILLVCEKGHEYNLEAYLKKGFISKKNAGILSMQAQEGISILREAQNRPFNASNFIADSKVVDKGWPCVKCNNPAKCAPGDPLKQNRALCLTCRADFMALRWKEDIFPPSYTHGRPKNLFYAIQFKRFLNDMFPISGDARKRLLEDCRLQAQWRQKNSDEEFIDKTAKDFKI